MARLLWLADVLRSAGLPVVEYPGWQSRGSSSFGPVEGIVCHHTGAGLKATDADTVRLLAVTGTPSAPTVPICQLYLSRAGVWWVVASGTATGVRTGTAGPLKGRGDDSVLQVEAQHSGRADEAWGPAQYRSYVRGCAALARKLGIDARMVIGHKEHQPGQKSDPTFDMDQFRRDVVAAQAKRVIRMFFLQIKGDPTQAVYVSNGINTRPVPAGQWELTCAPLIAAGVPFLDHYPDMRSLLHAGGPLLDERKPADVDVDQLAAVLLTRLPTVAQIVSAVGAREAEAARASAEVLER